MATSPFLQTAEGKRAWEIRERQQELLLQKQDGWTKLDLADSETCKAVCDAASEIGSFEEAAFVEKRLPLRFVVETIAPTKAVPSAVSFLKHLSEKFIPSGIFLKGKSESIQQKPSMVSVVDEEQVKPVEEVPSDGEQSEEEIVFRPIVEEGSSCTVTVTRTVMTPETRLTLLAEKKAILETMNHGNKMSAIKKKGKKNKKGQEETDDEMLDRLIRENRVDTELLFGDLTRADEDTAAEERRQFVREYVTRPEENLARKEHLDKEEELKDEKFQDLLASRISVLEPAPIADIFSQSDVSGAVALAKIEKAVELFIQDIKTVMCKGMKEEVVENWFYEKFRENVVLPVPNEDDETRRKRSAMVHKFMWRYKPMYVKATTNFERVLCMTFLHLFLHIQEGEDVVLPTIEQLVKLDGTPEFDAKQDAILRTILGQYFCELERLKTNSKTSDFSSL